MPEKPRIKSSAKGRSPVKTERETAVKGKRSVLLGEIFRPDRLKWLMLVALSLIIAVSLFPNILTKPRIYRPGDVAEKGIKASHDFLIENKELTEKNRERAAKEVLSVYDFDSSASNLPTRIKEAFNLGRESLDPAFQLGQPEQSVPSSGEKADTPEEDSLIRKRFFALLDIPPDEKVYENLVRHGFPTQVAAAVIQLTNSVFNRLKKGGLFSTKYTHKKRPK
jgi:hypothetical protein